MQIKATEAVVVDGLVVVDLLLVCVFQTKVHHTVKVDVQFSLLINDIL